VSSKSAIGDLAGILGGPPTASMPQPVKTQQPAGNAEVRTPSAREEEPCLQEDDLEKSDRVTALLPISLLSQLETRVAALRRKKKVSMSGYIEAAVRELLDRGEQDLEILEKHRISARRTMPRQR
jgi:hypothetical protein